MVLVSSILCTLAIISTSLFGAYILKLTLCSWLGGPCTSCISWFFAQICFNMEISLFLVADFLMKQVLKQTGSFTTLACRHCAPSVYTVRGNIETLLYRVCLDLN